MSERKALVVAFDNSDKAFFTAHPARHAHIRLPFQGEAAGEFFSLGDHNRARRRILLWRVPKDNPHYHALKSPILKIPFLVHPAEDLADIDEALMPVIQEIMEAQA